MEQRWRLERDEHKKEDMQVDVSELTSFENRKRDDAFLFRRDLCTTMLIGYLFFAK